MTHLTLDQLRAAYARYNRGESAEFIARDYGISCSYLRSRWHREGIWTGGRDAHPNRIFKVTDDEVRASNARCATGAVSTHDEAKRLGIRADTLRKRWRKIGLKVDSRHLSRWMKPGPPERGPNPEHACVGYNGTCLVCDRKMAL